MGLTSIGRLVVDGTGRDDGQGRPLDLGALPGDGERGAVAGKSAGRRVRLRGCGAQLESSWSVTATVLAARADAGLVVVPAEGWLLPPPPQAVSSSAAARPAAAGSAMA
jgi:hypothetical protein